MKLFRQILFWSHLVAGLIAGISIFIMCFTGAVIAFEHEIVEWAERDVRQVTPPADAKRLPVDELFKKVRETQPDARPSGIVVSSDPRDAVAFIFGRDGAVYANPYTGEIKKPATTKTHDFMHVMEDWHRVLAMGGDNRATGKAINGACNLAFFALAVTGLYLWMPRTWSWRGVKAIAIFNWQLVGKARNFNWHNAIGLWSAPVLIVLTLTAVPISYRWGGNLIYKIAGEQPPAQAQQGAGAPAVEVPRPSPDARPVGYDALLASAQSQFPKWETLTLRLGGGQQRGPGGQGNQPRAASATTPPAGRETRAASDPARPAGESSRPAGDRRGGENRPAVAVTVKEPGSWPRTATTTLTLNPFTGEVMKREGYADLAKSRQIRSWTRFLHTGQALGWPGQLVAGLACLGGCVLAYTGFALAWRRFFGKKVDSSSKAKVAKTAEVSSSGVMP